jgi:hypothetical protein
VIPFETVLDNDYFQSHKKLQYYHIYQKAKTEAVDSDGSFLAFHLLSICRSMYDISFGHDSKIFDFSDHKKMIDMLLEVLTYIHIRSCKGKFQFIMLK